MTQRGQLQTHSYRHSTLQLQKSRVRYRGTRDLGKDLSENGPLGNTGPAATVRQGLNGHNDTVEMRERI